MTLDLLDKTTFIITNGQQKRLQKNCLEIESVGYSGVWAH
jgi:hypothetical protein